MNKYPWIKFALDTRRFGYDFWFRLGECVSKCEHIRRVPLMPEVAGRLHAVYLAKGVHATTAIEGNTLTEAHVQEAIEGRLKVEDSRKYLQQEVENVLSACNDIAAAIQVGGFGDITPGVLCELNGKILRDVPCEEGVEAGKFRKYRVGVGRYRGPAGEDVGELVGDFCEWINRMRIGKDEGIDAVGFSVIKAIVAHLYIAWIHPFGDGNGRTARLVEFAILLNAGVPSPAAHLLSNHYNATRSEYYRQLDATSKSGGDISEFFKYAINGFHDGLTGVIEFLIRQVQVVSWEHYVFEYFRGLPAKDSHRRQRSVVIALSREGEPVSKERLEELTAKIYLDAKKTKNTFTRDINVLVKTGLVREEGGMYRADMSAVIERLPFSR
jgi:Fic family protein